jgi:hypothetical protein
MIATLLTFFLVGLVGLIALGLIMAFIGLFLKVALGLAFLLLFKIAPIVLLGYLLVRFLAPRKSKIDESGEA